MAKKTVVGEDGKKYRMKEKKPFYKKIWFWVIIAFLVIGGIGGLGGDKDKVATSSDKSKVESKNNNNKTDSTKNEEKKATTVSVGQLLSVGAIEYTVNSVETNTNVGGEYGSTSNGIYLIVNVTITNKGDESVTTTSSFFQLLNDGKTFDADSTAGIYANKDGSNALIFEQINPDVSLTGNLVFDVSQEVADSQNKQLKVQTGYFGTETGLINLQ